MPLKYLCSVLSLFFLLALVATIDCAADDNKAVVEKEPLFTLDSGPDDTPSLLKLKASLRLFVGYNAAVAVLKECGETQIRTNYEKRNGNSLGLAFREIKNRGGLKPEQKTVVDEAIKRSSHLALTDTCNKVAKDIDSGGWDIYKAERFLEDYKLVRQK